MEYNAGSVANYYLRKAKHEGIESSMTQMKLLKLVYFAHGFYAGITGDKLVSEPFQAWKYGPVVPELYSEFSNFGTKPINRPSREYDQDFKVWNPYDEPNDVRDLKILDDVWNVYGKLDGIRLSNLSHDPSGPWAKIRDENKRDDGTVPDNLEIPFHYISEYFSNLASG
jgi:uncharacterized phage-associated protein